jgi:hypothetical protein
MFSPAVFLERCTALPSKHYQLKNVQIYIWRIHVHANSLSFNSIGNVGAKELAVALQTNTSVISLR